MPKGVGEVLSERQNLYGDALENFEIIGKVWGALLQIDPVPPYQVALMMDALKTVRLFKNGQHLDSWLDKQGYTSHGIDIATR